MNDLRSVRPPPPVAVRAQSLGRAYARATTAENVLQRPGRRDRPANSRKGVDDLLSALRWTKHSERVSWPVV